MIKKSDILLSITAGGLLVLGFPPFDFYPLAWIALVPLFIATWEKKAKASFFLGTLTGFVYFHGILYWIFNSVYFYGNVPAILSLLLLILLCLYLGIYIGIFSVLFNSLSRHSRCPALFIAPVLWVTLEFARTYVLTGFPWSLLGYSQYKFLPLIQVADITGIYGISFLVAAFNGVIFDVAVYLPKRSSKMPLFAQWPVTVGIIVYAVIMTITLSYGLWRLSASEDGQKIKVSVIQGNIEQGKKWDSSVQKKIIDTYKRLSIRASEGTPDIIIWPESALPFVFNYDETPTAEFLTFQKELGAPLLFGSVMVKDTNPGASEELSNSAVLLSPKGNVLSIYDKIHLVPYGEYIPLRRFSPYVRKLVAAIGNFKAGKEHTVMETSFAKIGNLICYEIIFPGLVRKFVDKGANVLVTITNDAWFGRTSAPYQHFVMSVFRAVENRVPIIRAANTGISGFINTKGIIKRKSDIFVEAVLTENVSVGSSSKSFYTKFGDLFAFLCIISSVLLIANNLYPERKKLK